MIPLLGFSPDVDPTTPGVLTDCENVIPFEGGLKGAPVAVTVGAAALAAACRGASVVSDLAGNRRLFAGTSTKLYELSGTSWTDRSRGANYTLGTDDRWAYVQFGDSTIAVTPSAIVQRSTSGAFADVAGSPQAKLVESAAGFVMVLNTSVSEDQWHCSAYLDETDWVTSLTTQSASGRLVGGSGPINAARRFGDDIVAYKGGTMFVGRYVGAPEIWRWVQVSNDIGCVGQDAVVDTAVGHIFVGRDNVYIYDGTTPRPVPGYELIRRWLFGDMSPTYRYKTQCLWDRVNHLVWIYYPSAGSTGTVDRCAVYHVLKGQWGIAHSTIEATVSYNTPTSTYDGGITGVTTYDSGPAIPFDSLYWISGQSNPAVFTASHVLSTLSGECASASFTTGDFGDDDGYVDCMEFRVRYTQKPTTSAATGAYKDDAGNLVTMSTANSLNDGRHDARQSGRWHRFEVETTGDFKATAVRPKFIEGGKR